LLKSESFQSEPSFVINFEIRIRPAAAGEDKSRPLESRAERILFSMARMIKDPAGGDVEFIFLHNGKLREPARRLYGSSYALEGSGFDYECTITP
jgi:hypothetical protein